MAPLSISRSWTELHPATGPSARRWASMVFDSQNSRFVLFGGQSESRPPSLRSEGEDTGQLADMWSYDLATDTWSELTPPRMPPARSAAAMVYDSDLGQIILHGGAGLDGFLNDTWVYRP